MKKSSFNLFCSSAITLLIFFIPISSATELSLTYDGNGNLITGDGKYREYNEFNQLIRVRDGNTVGGDVLEEYIHHSTEDRILLKKINTDEFNPFDEVTFYFSDSFVRHRTNVEGNDHITDSYYVRDDNGIVGEVSYNTTKIDNDFNLVGKRFYHNDHLGSTSVITNESGDVVEQTFYDPYGEILSGGQASRFDYEGKEFSQYTEDYDYNFRKYDPELGIFTQPEQIFPNVYDPQQLNRYSFERRNPYLYVDEDGKSPHLAVAGIVGGVIGLTVGGITYYQTGSLSKSLTAGGIAGVGTFASVALPGIGGTSASLALSGLRFGGLATIGGVEYVAQQTLVQGRGFNDILGTEIATSSLYNLLSGTKAVNPIKSLVKQLTYPSFSRFERQILSEIAISSSVIGLQSITISYINLAQNYGGGCNTAYSSCVSQSSTSSSGSRSGGGGGSGGRYVPSNPNKIGKPISGGGICGITASCA